MTTGTIECDVCLQAIPPTKISGHILLHMSQIIQLCKSLPRTGTDSNEDLRSYDDDIDDADSHCDATDQEPSKDRSDLQITATRRMFKCPAYYEIKKTCDKCFHEFSKASKYVWHRCGPDAASCQESYKSRWQSLRKEVGRALDQACGVVEPRRSRQVLRTEPPKRRKTEHLGQCSMDAATIITPLLSQDSRPAVEREAFPSNAALQLIPNTSLPQAEDSVQPNDPVAIGANFPQACDATDYSSTWCVSSSEAPIIWDDWNWLGGESWVSESAI
ncbi:hypothetical protein CEP51_014451 [Fusarium floridanum]|uniref:Uncharacterized protein n=1 Tax=Fusarium floridanum TaxID=1325733 RepID=A0A428PST9_9HYPO|nr:hypothetical protein CEP51_014451 [Fusarium floridanum]